MRCLKPDYVQEASVNRHSSTIMMPAAWKHAWPSLCAVMLSLAVIAPFVDAAATPEEAARLKSDLTPFGAERAGNKEGSIPAWDGGYTTVWPGYRTGQPRPDPFANEKPLLQITAQNMAQHADKLSDGVKALLQRYRDYRLNVYPTHRTAAAPQWVYDNTFRNATRARSDSNGLAIAGVYGGIPFPIPKSGTEAMWNHELGWKGEALAYEYNTYVIAGGKPVLTTGGRIDFQFPYYYRNGSLEDFKGIALLFKLALNAPPFRAGEISLIHDPVDQFRDGRKAWQYIVGQRRVRRAPTIAYDTPSITSGFSFNDEGYVFNGPMDRFEWKLLGKKEMFVPYNTNAFHLKKTDQVIGPQYVNPDHLRWELHRVWVVEATLADGKRHALPRRRFYLDEDTWFALLTDGWDARQQLWHVSYQLPMLIPELPAVSALTYVVHDLFKGGYVVSSLLNEGRRHYEILPRRPEDEWSPAALTGEGVR